MPSPGSVAQPMPGRVMTPSVPRPSPFGRAQRVPSPGPPTLVCINNSWGLGESRTICLEIPARSRFCSAQPPHLSLDPIFIFAASCHSAQNTIHTHPISSQS
jgi:hypothetical protein